MKINAEYRSRDLRNGFKSRVASAIIVGTTAYCCALDASAQVAETPASISTSSQRTGWKPPVTNQVFTHFLFNQLEDRTGGSGNELRWDGEGWIGTDMIAQPQLEMNFYGSPDPARGLGTGLTDLDTGLRVRYEFSRKLAPYIGFAYTNQFGSTAAYSRQVGEPISNPRFVVGLRIWY
jgi:uncharacterized protein involved in copper resistance